ncbi:MAG: T9SS type A sorting domain-containing protein [Flavobacteriaceae bacterium]|nr:T9SS type A sorting domain-containing protein [Flavobacteriaceae bacterium]
MKTTTFIFLATLLSVVSSAQTVNTFIEGTPDDAIALDADGNIYASNFTGDSVFKFDSNGTATTFVSGLDTPNGLDFDSNGNLYVCDFNANELFRYDSSGILDASITIPGNPSGIVKAWDNDDMIYTRYNVNTINRVTPSGVFTEVSSDPALNGPVGLAYDSNGQLYVANYNNREVFKVLANGDLEYIATVGTIGNLGFIAYGQGMLWGTGISDHKIYVIDPTGVDEVNVFAGSSAGSMDGDIAQATFNRPNGIAFSEDETTLYITDFGTKNLRIITGVVLSAGDISLKNSEVKLFPNPTTNLLNIQINTSETGSATLKVYDILGKTLFSSELILNGNLTSSKVDVSAWNSGTYFVEIISQNGSITKRFIR